MHIPRWAFIHNEILDKWTHENVILKSRQHDSKTVKMQAAGIPTCREMSYTDAQSFQLETESSESQKKKKKKSSSTTHRLRKTALFTAETTASSFC